MGDKYQNPGLYLTPRQIIRLLDTLFSIIFKHRTKRISGCGRKPPGRQRHIIETRSESVSLRPRLKKEADIQVKRPHSVVCSDFTPLYSLSKAPRIKSIRISINKTGHKTEERGKVARKENTSSQQEEDMFKEVTQIQNLFVKLRSGSRPGEAQVRSSSDRQSSDFRPGPVPYFGFLLDTCTLSTAPSQSSLPQLQFLILQLQKSIETTRLAVDRVKP